MNTLKPRFIGLTATLGLLLLLFGTPVVLVASTTIPSPGDLSSERLTSPDDGTLALAVIGLVAWLAWLAFIITVGLELFARIRRTQVPRLPGLAVPQVTVGRLVALAALLFVAVPAITPALPAAPRAVAGPPPAAPDHARDTDRGQAATTAAAVSDANPNPGADRASDSAADGNIDEATATVAYTVKRGDSLWKIAQRHLGDGRRYDEIVALNERLLHGEPDFIAPGTVLQIPDPRPPDPEATYVVRPGDTLSHIAQTHLGDASAYAQIVDASRHTVQPDGARLSDPDHIRPGWRLTIPNSNDTPDTPPARHDAPEAQPNKSTGATPTPTGPPSTAPPPVSDRGVTDPATSPAEDDSRQDPSDEGAETPGWVVPGLTGAGAVLAGSLLLVLRQHRRTQLRYRRPGRIIAPPPAELRSTEKTAHLAGTITAPKVDALDQALRHLAAVCPTPPPLRTVHLADDTITLGLTELADLPDPWAGGPTTWKTSITSELPDASGQVPPYPLLVSLGQADDGALVLVNLEELRTVTITGDHDTATQLGRHLVAELSLNPWSGSVEIDTTGIGAELSELDPLRLHHHDTDTAFLNRIATDLETETTAPNDAGADVVVNQEPDRFRIVMTTGDHADEDATRNIAKIITTCTSRSGAALVAINTDPSTDDTKIDLTNDGRLRIDTLDLDLIAAGLTSTEAAACAAIVDLTREPDDTAVPVADTDRAKHGEEPVVDHAGALRMDMAEPRPTDPAAPAGDRSLLPHDTAVYEQMAATTADDLETLAPVVAEQTERELAEADPHLDEHVALWNDPDASVPRLTLLGPVNAKTVGKAKAVARRKPFYTELLAFLALHPHGVTTPEVCDAFGLKPARAHTDLGVVRRWLGTNPLTGEPHLPSARPRQGDTRRGMAVYQLHGVLTDLDLFRRLRTRAQSRGADGIPDLIAALNLVTGEPFSHLRPAGWNWLLDGDRMDHIATCAIVDVAHIVTTHALSTDDHDLARRAAETAYTAAPDDETSRLDMIQVAAATGHADTAQRQLIDDVFNRSDDNLGPVDLPERTATVIRQHQWDRTPQASDR